MDNQDYSLTCKQEMLEFTKCTRDELRNSHTGMALFELTTYLFSDKGVVSICNPLAARYSECEKSKKASPKVERANSGQKNGPPPPCEIESTLYGQCMGNLLDNEIHRKGFQPNAAGEILFDASKCKLTLAAFEKCLNTASTESKLKEEDLNNSVNLAGKNHWMSSVFWQGPTPPSS